MDVSVLEFMALLRDKEVIVPELPTHPHKAMEILRTTCEELRPDVIVSLLGGAYFAQQISGYYCLLISPDYPMLNVPETLFSGEAETQIPYQFDRLDGQQHLCINAN